MAKRIVPRQSVTPRRKPVGVLLEEPVIELLREQAKSRRVSLTRHIERIIFGMEPTLSSTTEVAA